MMVVVEEVEVEVEEVPVAAVVEQLHRKYYINFQMQNFLEDLV